MPALFALARVLVLSLCHVRHVLSYVGLFRFAIMNTSDDENEELAALPPTAVVFPTLHTPSLDPIGQAIQLSTFMTPKEFFERARRKHLL